jgi:hypothetical protein
MRLVPQRFTLLPILLLATLGHWLYHGLDSLPKWIGNLAMRAGMGELTAARVLVGVMGACALSLLIVGVVTPARRRMAKAIAVVYAFGAVASIAASLASEPVSWSLLLPAFGLFVAVAEYASLAHPMMAIAAPRRLGGVLLAFVVVGAWCLAIGIAARLDFAPRSKAAPSGAMETIVLDHVSWEGRTIPDTGLSRLVPHLTARTLEGRSIVILYNPECQHCREVFEQYLTLPIPDTRIIGIEIPPNPGTVPLTGDDLGKMPCASCEWMSLPPGRHYAIKTPTVLVVMDGRVTCATNSDFPACLSSLPALNPPASTTDSPPPR